ncbi:GGDEF domain-containing protein [Amorphus suaedae]
MAWFAVLLAGSLSLLGLGISVIHDREKAHRMAELEAGEKRIASAQFLAVRDHLKLIRSDVLFLRNEYESVLNAGDGDPRNAATEIAERYRNFSRSREAYDDLRIIAPSGKEAVRINRSGGTSIIVEAAELQDKSGHPYFAPIQNLDYDEVYISPLDLGTQSAGGDASDPPTLHVATPARTSPDGSVASIVLNYRADPMLSSIKEAAELSTGDPVMLDSSGNWLVPPAPLRKGGFTLPDGNEEPMPAGYPATWAAAQTETSGRALTPEGLFTFQVIAPLDDAAASPDVGADTPFSPRSGPASADGHVWFVGTFVPADSLDDEIDEPAGAAHIYMGLILVLCVAGSAAGAIAIAESRNYRRTLERLATEDSLTGLANRRALEARLAQEIELSQRKRRRVTLAFLDVDGFKAVNDELGHAVGDQALADIADVIEANVRSYDVVGRFRAGERGSGAPLTARIGGDEFVIMFPDSSGPETARSVLHRISTGVGALSWDGRRVSLSAGIATYPEDGTTGDALLRAADHAMYQAKTSGKNRVVVAAEAALAGAPEGSSV